MSEMFKFLNSAIFMYLYELYLPSVRVEGFDLLGYDEPSSKMQINFIQRCVKGYFADR